MGTRGFSLVGIAVETQHDQIGWKEGFSKMLSMGLNQYIVFPSARRSIIWWR
ncbi:MAG: hypothetical protein ACTSVZ_13870 [Promethearchaeota archaeon]